MAKVTAKEVVQFLREADLDVAELILSVGEGIVEAQRAKKAEASKRMEKARAGRKPKGSKVAAPTVPVVPTAGRVPAPAHTRAATSVESDTLTASA